MPRSATRTWLTRPSCCTPWPCMCLFVYLGHSTNHLPSGLATCPRLSCNGVKLCFPHLYRMPSDEGTPVVPQRRCFTEFLSAFPVSLQGQPPSKVQRTGCGFPGDRAYYDKWRLSQYDLRRAHLLGKSPKQSIQRWHPLTVQ